MKNYTITVNGNVYDVTVEEKVGGAAQRAAAQPQWQQHRYRSSHLQPEALK